MSLLAGQRVGRPAWEGRAQYSRSIPSQPVPEVTVACNVQLYAYHTVEASLNDFRPSSQVLPCKPAHTRAMQLPPKPWPASFEQNAGWPGVPWGLLVRSSCLHAAGAACSTCSCWLCLRRTRTAPSPSWSCPLRRAPWQVRPSAHPLPGAPALLCMLPVYAAAAFGGPDL